MLLADPLDQLRSRLGFRDPLPAEPVSTLAVWLAEARRDNRQPNPDAMVLATAAPDGRPSARVVLCKSIDARSGTLVFFTNYASRKAREIEANPRVACVFHWDHVGRQARVEGSVARIGADESDAYFRTRPLLSRLAAWASEQGRPLRRRTDLIARVRQAMERFGVGLHHLALPATSPNVPRPESWGGYRVAIESAELWVGGSGRLHDRVLWTRSLEKPAAWSALRLQP